MHGEALIETLRSALRDARQSRASEVRLAYGLLAAGAGEAMPDDLDAARDGLWRIAFVAFVRAPAADLGWLITPYLLLDRIYRQESSLDDLVDRLAELEREWAEAGTGGEQAADTPLGRLATEASRADEVLTLSGAPLAEAIRAAIQRVRAASREGGLLARADQGYRAPDRSRTLARSELLALSERAKARPNGD